MSMEPWYNGHRDLPHPMGSYLYAGTLGMFLWDFTVNLQDEYQLLLKPKITIPTIVYFWCRLSGLCGVAVGTVFFTTPLNEWCSILAKIMLIGYALVIASSSLLFVLFVRAFYTGSNRFKTIFSVLSLFVAIGSSAMPPFIGVGVQATTTSPYCTIINKQKWLSQSVTVTMLVHKFTIFWAIAMKLVPSNDEEEQSRTRVMKIRNTLEGKHLPEFSRTLWRNGQKYLLAYMTTSLMTLAAFSTNTFPEVYGFVFSGIHTAVHTCLTSYLIRRIRAASLNPERNMNMTSGFLAGSGLTESRHVGGHDPDLQITTR